MEKMQGSMTSAMDELRKQLDQHETEIKSISSTIEELKKTGSNIKAGMNSSIGMKSNASGSPGAMGDEDDEESV